MAKKGLKEQLATLEKDELVELLAGLAEEYSDVKKNLTIRFIEAGSRDSLKQYKSIIKTSIRQFAGRHNFVSYGQVYKALAGTRKVLEAAEDALAKGKHLAAVDIASLVLHEMSDFMQMCDDSGGDVGEMIREGLEILQRCAEQSDRMEPGTRSSLLAALLKEAAHPDWEDWNEWKLSLMASAALLIDDQQEREQWSKRLDELESAEEARGYGREFFAEHAAQLRYSVMLEFDGQERAKQFVEEHLGIKAFRDIAIDEAIGQERYDDALTLIEAGERQDRAKGYPGLVHHWEEKRALVYERSGDLASFRALAKKFMLSGEYKYYVKLKETTASAEWEAVLEPLLDELEEATTEGSWKASWLYAKLLVEEQCTERLLRYVEQNPLSLVSYYEHLVEQYPYEVYMLFVKTITESCRDAVNRKQYRKVCDLIRHLIRAGGGEHADKVMQSLRETYPKRAALMDELDRVNNR